jgi:hypothetical protein
MRPMISLWQQLTWWTLAFPLVMIVAILRHDIFLLNWIHVLSGALWTGADLFMGFILGPVLRMLDMGARTALIAFLVPRTLLYFPMVSLTAGTAGWFLADWFGFTAPGSPLFHLTLISLALVGVMTVIGLGFLLPNSLRIWWSFVSLSLTVNGLSVSTESISGLQARRASCKSSLFS